jgi:hypothetical protein
MNSALRTVLCVILALLVSACANKPQPPEWQIGSRDALERYQRAWLAGSNRAADAEFTLARRTLAATGQAAMVARAELTRCALQVASLDFQPCNGFEPLRADADASAVAYASYLQAAALSPSQVQLLPKAHQGAAAGPVDAATLAAIDDPLSRLVAAAVQVRGGHASPRLLEVAVETASAQGWRRPLLAWLGAQARAAQLAGNPGRALELRRRMELAAP